MIAVFMLALITMLIWLMTTWCEGEITQSKPIKPGVPPSLYDHWRARIDSLPRDCVILDNMECTAGHWRWIDSESRVTGYLSAVEAFVETGLPMDLECARKRAEPLFEHYEMYYQELATKKRPEKPPKPPGLFTVLKEAQKPCTCEMGLATVGDARRFHDWYCCVSVSQSGT